MFQEISEELTKFIVKVIHAIGETNIPNGNMALIDVTKVEVPIVTSYNASKDVSFTLFTRRFRIPFFGKILGQKITFNRDAIANTFYNSALPTIFIIHGWLNNRETNYISEIKDAYLERGDYNIVSECSLTTYEAYKIFLRSW